MPKPSFHQRLFLRLTDSTPGEAEGDVPANFCRLLLSSTGIKIADRLASPKTTLAWLLQALGAPAIFIGIIVPLRESGALLPQAFLGNYLKRFPRRKWAWSLGAILQGSAIAGCAVVALTLTGVSAGLAIICMLFCFSLARGISSVTSKDILGKTIPKSKRGQLTGWSGSVSGLIAVLAATLLIFVDEEKSIRSYAVYLAVAAAIWWVTAFVYLGVTEPEGDVEKMGSLSEGVIKQFSLLKSDVNFRNFLIVRAFAIGSGLSTPFIIALAHDRLGGAALWLGVFMIVEGLSATLTGPIWGEWADRSSRAVLRGSMLLVSVLLLATVTFAIWSEGEIANRIFFPLILFLLGSAHAGVRVGRQTYVIDMAEGNKRTDYVAVGNTLIGIALIIAGILTGLASMISIPFALGIFALTAAIGALYGQLLPSVSQT
ncbi:MFS transporter [bacterium]|nr:MFS transporter [bacterium]